MIKEWGRTIQYLGTGIGYVQVMQCDVLDDFLFLENFP